MKPELPWARYHCEPTHGDDVEVSSSSLTVRRDDVTPARRYQSRFADLTIESLDEVLVSLGRELQETQSESQDHFEKLSW